MKKDVMHNINSTEQVRGCCHTRHKMRDAAEKKLLINRLCRIEGQIRGVHAMVDNETYCPDILIQISAARAALGALAKELLVSHINSCVKEDISSGKEGAAEELAELLRRLMK